jgi:carbohydrate-selective porin OprB
LNGSVVLPKDKGAGGEGAESKIGTAGAHAGEAREPSWYQRIEMAFEATAAVQGSLGAEPEFSEEEDVTDATIAFCLEISVELTGASNLCAVMEAGSGDGLDGDLPTFWGFNDDADDDANVRLTELGYDHHFFGERLTVRLGKIDLTGDCGCNDSGFDGNAVGGEFLSSGFCNNVAVEFPDDNSAGIMAWWSPHKLVDFGVALADADADWDNVADNVFFIAELDIKPVIFGKSGTYRAFGWINDKPHALIDKPELDDRPGHGFGLSFDQEICAALSIFGRYAWERPDVYAVEHAWSAGRLVGGEVWKRADDAFGFAYGMAKLSGEMEDVYEAEGLDVGDEHHLEFFYDLKVNDWITVRQDVQYAKNPEGLKDGDDVWVLGLRAQVGF